MTIREHLEAARELIRDKERWCGAGWGRESLSPSHTTRCAVHALSTVNCNGREAYKALALQAGADILDKWVEICPNAPEQTLVNVIGGFNDSHTHAEVLELFNLAIADEIAKEKAYSRHMTEEAEREQAEDPAALLVFA